MGNGEENRIVAYYNNLDDDDSVHAASLSAGRSTVFIRFSDVIPTGRKLMFRSHGKSYDITGTKIGR